MASLNILTTKEKLPTSNYVDSFSPIDSLATMVVLANLKVSYQIIGVKVDHKVGVRYFLGLENFPNWQRKEISKMKDHVISHRTIQAMYPNEFHRMLEIQQNLFTDLESQQA